MVDVDNDSGKSAGPSTREVLLFAPILGSALAVIYDVGFFRGLNIGFFTIFSLNEHIVFALEYLPGSLLLVLAAAFVAYVVPWLNMRGIIDTRRVAFITSFTLLCAAPLVAWWLDDLLAVIISIGIIVGALLFVVSKNFGVRIYNLILVTSLVSFGLGFRGGFIIKTNQPYSFINREAVSSIVTTREGSIEGQIIRTGDRGVLFVETKKNRLTLLRWDQIKEINAPR